MTKLKEQIISLRNEGLTYDEIKLKLNCSKAVIAYYLSPKVKEYYLRARVLNNTKNMNKLRELLGNKCKTCGYFKCKNALEFHHLDPSTKDGTVTKILRDKGLKYAMEEIKKCILLCANCHRELHAEVDKSSRKYHLED